MRRRIARIVWAKCTAPPSSRSSRSTEVITTCDSPSFSTACATRPGSKTSSASGRPVATLQKVQPRVQVSPMIIMVAWPCAQHSPTFGQPASWQTVCSPCSRTILAVSKNPFEVGALTRIQGGLAGEALSGRCAFSGWRWARSVRSRGAMPGI